MPVTRQQVVLAACCAIVGVPTLILGFALNPGPPPGLSFAQMAVFGTQHRTLILLGGWFQIMGTLLTVLYALAMVYFAGWSTRLAGSLTLLGSTVLLVVGLMEVMFYVAVTSGDPMTLQVVTVLLPGLQHSYALIAAPMVFLPFSYIVGASNILPRPFAYCGILIGATFVLLGFFGMLYPLQMIVDILSAFQGLWWLTAAIATLISGMQGRLTPLTESSTAH